MSAPDVHERPVPPTQRRRALDVRGLGRDALVVACWSVVAGLLAAVLWWRLADLPRASKTADGVVLDPVQLTRQVSIDGWYFVLAAVGGVLSGAALTTWRRRDPVATVLLAVLGAGLSAYLAIKVGLWLGPDSPESVLRSRPVGATAPVRLALQATGAAWVWPLAAALGALAVLWSTPKRDQDPA